MMTLQPHEQVLIDGGRRELLEFGSCKHCIVVDWRDNAETILGEVKRMLPEGYLTAFIGAPNDSYQRLGAQAAAHGTRTPS